MHVSHREIYTFINFYILKNFIHQFIHFLSRHYYICNQLQEVVQKSSFKPNTTEKFQIHINSTKCAEVTQCLFHSLFNSSHQGLRLAITLWKTPVWSAASSDSDSPRGWGLSQHSIRLGSQLHLCQSYAPPVWQATLSYLGPCHLGFCH